MLRQRAPRCRRPAPYRVPLFPLLPLVFMVTVLGVIAATVIETPGDAGMSLVIIALGVPVHWVWRRWQRRGTCVDGQPVTACHAVALSTQALLSDRFMRAWPPW